MKALIHLCLVAAGAYGVLVGLVYFKQDGLIYLPLSTLVTTPAEHGMDYEDVYLTTDDGVRLHGWFVPAPEPRGVLLFFHGNAGNISHRMASIRIFRELGLSVFIIDYRGYGQSEGRPSEAGLRRDARAAWAWLRETREIPAREIVVFGRSLGAAVAVDLASEHPPGALILESAFTSAADLGAEVYPWLPVGRLLRHRHEVIESLPQVRVPTLIAHSRQDEIVSFDHARRLMDVAHDGAVLLEMEAGHNDGFLRTGQRYVRGLGDFLEEHVFGELP
ncbi:alpha/beta hydrolase [Thioalkalivibrio sulfidiphilus]|uniref:alpha/beta hydrolase n=1 Tax=Thioalkalivibrio sulfidiphilus TaxID=1033854 RepID=UPI003B2994E1